MQEFLLLIHGTGYPDEETPEVLSQHIEKYKAWVNKLSSNNQYVKGARLDNSGRAIIDDGERIVSDGPYLESKEIVGGYILVKANSLSEAVSLAENCPLSKDFVISVRPMYNWPTFANYDL